MKYETHKDLPLNEEVMIDRSWDDNMANFATKTELGIKVITVYRYAKSCRQIMSNVEFDAWRKRILRCGGE